MNATRRSGAVICLLLAGSVISACAQGASSPTTTPAGATTGAPASIDASAGSPSATASTPPEESMPASPSGADFQSLVADGKITTSAICSGYEAVMKEFATSAAKRIKDSSRAVDDPFAAAQFVDENDWTSGDASAEFSAAMDASATKALNIVSDGQAGRVASIAPYLAASIGSCGFTEQLASVTAQQTEVTSVSEQLRTKAEAKPWYPKGYEEWVDGVAFRFNRKATSSSDLWGWAYDAISRDGCPGGLYVEANFINGDTVVDYGNDLIRSLKPMQKALVQLRVGLSSHGVDTFQVTEVTCN